MESTIRKKNSAIKVIGDLFSYRWIVSNIPFVLFLSVLAVFYIANGHMADNRIRKINDVGRKLKDLQYEYKTQKSEMMYKSRESEMINAVEPLGLEMDSTSAFRISLVKHNNTNQKN